ncbi:MAG: metal ABC transporter permease [Actinobacteria bacterium]|nr:metal ABC transporter permease [Actinomycetota bacterium]
MVLPANVLAGAGYQPNWVEVLGAEFMRYALIGGGLVAIAAGLLGYFVVIRRQAFAAHALAHIGFPGATGAVLIGAPVTLGLAVFCIGGALAMGFLGRRLSERETATGTVLAFATGLGVLFSSLTTKGSANVTNVLFGNLLAISPPQLFVFGGFTLALVLAMAAVARPLTFASVNPDVAEAKGIPVRALGVVFLVLLALVITMAVQVVGTLLLFALVVTPSATALAITARPGGVAAIGTAIALGSVVMGLVLSAMFNLPPSFFIVSISFVAWILALALTRERRRPAPAVKEPAEPTDFHQVLRHREEEWARSHDDSTP